MVFSAFDEPATPNFTILQVDGRLQQVAKKRRMSDNDHTMNCVGQMQQILDK